jgi:hypothetical protein
MSLYTRASKLASANLADKNGESSERSQCFRDVRVPLDSTSFTQLLSAAFQ